MRSMLVPACIPELHMAGRLHVTAGSTATQKKPHEPKQDTPQTGYVPVELVLELHPVQAQRVQEGRQ